MGIIEAKKAGQTLIGVEEQSFKYLTNLPDILSTARSALPFSYETTGIETRFTNHLDPEPRSRQVFAFHRQETLAEWLAQAPPGMPNEQNDTLRARLCRLPPLPRANLRDCQVEAITNLELPFAENRPRALIQMATGSGKPFTAEQRQWLVMIRDHVAASLTIEPEDFSYEPFSQQGGLGKAYQLFGGELPAILQQLNERLAA